MLLVSFLIPRVDKDIVDEVDDKLMQRLTEDSVYKIHKLCGGNCESEWHHHELITVVS